jgi:hypothetical protein
MSTEAVWSRYHENLLKKWAEMSKTYSIMHSLCAEWYSVWHKRLGVPVMIIGGVTASSIFSSNQGQDKLWTYFNGGLALLFTVLSGVSNFLDMAGKTSKHQTASFKYTKIAMDIDTMLSFGRKERQMSPQEFMHAKKVAILEIRENVPEILPWVMADYLKKFDKSLMNIKSRVNYEGTPHPRASPNEIINMHGRGSETSSNNTMDDIEMQRHASRVRGRSVEMLADFADRLSKKIYNANQKIQSGYDSDFTVMGDANEHCDCEEPDDEDTYFDRTSPLPFNREEKDSDNSKPKLDIVEETEDTKEEKVEISNNSEQGEE